MSPATAWCRRFKPGQLAWVNPNLSARIGDDVIVQLRPHDEHDTPEGFIKELVKRTPSKLIVKQYNPEMEISFEQAEVLLGPRRGVRLAAVEAGGALLQHPSRPACGGTSG